MVKRSYLKNFVVLPVIISFLCLNFSCATVIRGTTHTFPVKSDISATVKFVGKDNGAVIEVQAPTTVELKRKQSYHVTVSAPGYETQNFEIEAKGDWGWLIIGDILIAGGVIGIIVDVCNGAYKTLNPAELDLHFENKKSELDYIIAPKRKIQLSKNESYLIPLAKSE